MTSSPAPLSGLRLSVLDRALTRRGEHPGQSLRESVHFAREAEAAGCHRFWVAEHHGVPGIAGSAPTVLASAVAAATSRIRVGTGGVMLPNHRPLVVAEQFGVLESLYPGRIDMGLGRSVGFTGAVREALGAGKESAGHFSELITELLGFFRGGGAVHGVPAEGLRVPAFVLAVGSGAEVAAEQGLPLVAAAHRDLTRTVAAIDRYRAAFSPSAQQPRPYVVVAVNAAVAGTSEEAELLQIPEAWATVRARTRGVFEPLLPAAEVPVGTMTEREERLFAEARQGQLRGAEERMAETLSDLVSRTGANELLTTLNTHDPVHRVDSLRRLARLTGHQPESV